MKRAIIIIFLALAGICQAQTSLEKKVLDLANEYRASLGAGKLEWNSAAANSAGMQAKYLDTVNKCAQCAKDLKDKRFLNTFGSHENPGAKMKTFYDRYMLALGKDSSSHKHSKVGEIIDYSTLYHVEKSQKADSTEAALAKMIIENWKNSKEHNKILTDPEMKYAGVRIFRKSCYDSFITSENIATSSVMVLTAKK
jgi:uncharacterized protein YkwD